MLECAAAAKFPRALHRLHKRKRPKEVSLGEHTSLGPKATAPITVICLSPDLTLGVSSRTYSGVDTRRGAIKFVLSQSPAFVKGERGRGLHARSPAFNRQDDPSGDRSTNQ